jgi:predicted dithiol-disulfide oxidoreductase (DUF899 family)
MSLPDVVSQQEWLDAKVGKEYVFEGPDGRVTLADLFGRRQLIVQHAGSAWASRRSS